MTPTDCVWAFMYNYMTEESSSAVESLHRTKKGAIAAMKYHKAEIKKEWEKMYEDEKPPYRFGKFETWYVQKMEILP